jgi:hypothetical protein
MNGMAISLGGWKAKSILWLSIGLGLIALVVANAHLLYVAVSSQPDCVAHLRYGEGNSANSFSAATSSCSSKPSITTKARVE